MNDPRRGTGRTTQTLTHARIGQMQGKRVLVIAHTYWAAREMARNFSDIFNQKPSGAALSFRDGAGVVLFRSPEMNKVGHRGEVLFDHFTHEYYYQLPICERHRYSSDLLAWARVPA